MVPKINIYLPDDLAEAVKEAGVPVSAVCQRALEQAVRRVAAVREATLGDVEHQEVPGDLARYTDRTRATLQLAAEQARDQESASVGTVHLLGGIVAEGNNLALRVLTAVDITPEQLRRELERRSPGTAEPDASDADEIADGAQQDGAARRFSGPAASALELAVTEAVGLGHNYVGTEHLLLGLIVEQDGVAGRILRSLGAEYRLTRRALSAALAGFMHLQAQTKGKEQPGGPQPADPLNELISAVRREQQPLLRRIEQLERRLGQA